MTQTEYKPSDKPAEKRASTKKVSKESKYTTFKNWVVNHWHEAMYVSHQLAKLVTAGALLTVSAVSFWYAYNHNFAVMGAKQWIMFSGILIGLLGAGQFLKTLGKK